MSDIPPPEPTLPEPPRRDRWIVGTALASLMLHAGVLAFLLWQPLPESAEAEQPPAIDVELVPPPETASEPPQSDEAGEEGAAGADTAPPEAPPAQEKASEEDPADAAAAAKPPADTAAAQPPAEQPPSEEAPTETAEPAREEAGGEAASETEAAPETPAEAQAQETPAGTAPTEAPSEAVAEAEPAASEAAASAAAAPAQGVVDTSKVAPIPLARPKVRGLTAQSDAPEAGAEPSDPVEVAEGAVTAATPEVPDVATLELGAQRSAQRFYLEAMLSTPRLAPAREMLKSLPHDKRLAQTCNIEALAQIGNAGEGFAPDVVMAEAYALSEMTGTQMVANGAIFRSREKWYGFAFDCTLSDDLTAVTGFSYRLGADVTEAVLKRLGGN